MVFQPPQKETEMNLTVFLLIKCLERLFTFFVTNAAEDV